MHTAVSAAAADSCTIWMDGIGVQVHSERIAPDQNNTFRVRIWLRVVDMVTAFSNTYIASSYAWPCPCAVGGQKLATMEQTNDRPLCSMPEKDTEKECREGKGRRRELRAASGFISVHIVYRYILDYKFLPQERLICN